MKERLEPEETVERRSHVRIPLQLHAEIEIYTNTGEEDAGNCIHARVTTIDASLGGFCVKIVRPSDTSVKCFSPAAAYVLAGKTITVHFKDSDMTVTGKVVRIDPRTLHMAVVITWVSDIMLWRQVCGQSIYDRSEK